MLHRFRRTDFPPRLFRTACAALSFGCAALGSSVALAQAEVPLKEASVLNRPVFLLSNDKLEVAIIKQGGAMLRVLLQGDAGGLSPFGNPEMVPAVPANRKLQGNMVGHFVAVDGFGSPSQPERAAGIAMHGEAYLAPWKLVSAEKQGAVATTKFTVDMPLLQETFTRQFRMVDGENVVYVNSELQNNVAFDRTANWGEHPFLYPPFLEPEKTVVDMSGTRAKTRTGGQRLPLEQGKEFTWPMITGTDGKQYDMRIQPAGANWNGHTTTLMDSSKTIAWVTILNTDKHYLLGYVFKHQEYPWVQNYMAYNTNGWSGRGIEFATQPFDLPHREMVELGKMFDTSVYRWLPAKGKITSSFLMFWVKSPEGMTHVDEVRLENGKLTIEDRTTNKTITLTASLPL
jgi:hypothetical protein